MDFFPNPGVDFSGVSIDGINIKQAVFSPHILSGKNRSDSTR